MALNLNCSAGDSLKIPNPSGIEVNAAHTLLIVAAPRSNVGDGRVIVRAGNASGSVETRGFAFAFTAAGVPRLRHPDGGFHEHATVLAKNTWYRMAVHSAGAGAAQRGITINGSKTTENMEPTTELSSGDELSVAYNLSGPGWDEPRIAIALIAWVQGVDLSGAEVEAYCQAPCSLRDDYGPDGEEEADALSLLLLGDLTTDQSGKGNHPTIVGGLVGPVVATAIQGG